MRRKGPPWRGAPFAARTPAAAWERGVGGSHTPEDAIGAASCMFPAPEGREGGRGGDARAHWQSHTQLAGSW